jgi:predicted phosphodiesterase
MELPISVFAVEDRAVQLSWAALPASDVTIEVGDQSLTVEASPPAWLRRLGHRPRRLSRLPGGPGAATIEGLEPARTYQVWVSGPGVDRRAVTEFTTLTPPPGELLARFATISDTHIGERRFGALATMEEEWPLRSDIEPYPLRSARAAVAEAEAWGAELIVVKGDLTRDSEPVEFREAARMLAATGLPVAVALGNHDVRHAIDGPALLAEHGLMASRQPRAIDLPGLRLVVGHTPVAHDKAGFVDAAHRRELAELVGATSSPSVVAVHHPPRRWPIETHYPPGIKWRDSQLLAKELTAANPDTLLISGHTHRNRAYRLGALPVAEVGSTKDYPGQWAGYAVYEGGIRQVVRRVSRPDVIAWTESTRRALGGVWGWWSAGTLGQRCWSLTWPSRKVGG